ncbi:MAG: exonuclease SbcCD subunit D [Lachnospiraceae bacterium]|nr:exonuclease SbcCD subunit D [Lachnospiraceae bacterium]
MRFLHISDLHIGKVVNDFSMLEDQKFILEQIAGIAGANHVDAVVIAGDVYDRAIPSGEAVLLFDQFLTGLSEQKIPVLLISGNHDSQERLSFGKELLGKQGVYIAGIKEEDLVTVEFEEASSDSALDSTLDFTEEKFLTQFVLLPFLKPSQAGASNSQEAVEKMLARYWEEERKQAGRKNGSGRKRESGRKSGSEKKNRVLVTHFFVTDSGRAPELSDSETTIHVGGIDNVEASVFEGFDYTALGHIHKQQQVGERPVWYAGAPLAYSFGEIRQQKGALLISIDGQGLSEVQPIPLRPMRRMRRISGTLSELLAKGQEDVQKQDYIQAELWDQGELIDPIGTLRSVYPNVMQILRKPAGQDEEKQNYELSENRIRTEKKDALALFEDFYQEVREKPLAEEGKRIVEELVKELEGQEGSKK